MKLFQPAPIKLEVTVKDPWWVDWFKRVSSRLGSGQAPQGIIPGASPYVLQNATDWDQDIIVAGGTVSAIEYSQDNITYYNLGVVAGMFRLSPLDYIRITYTGAPTVTVVTR